MSANRAHISALAAVLPNEPVDNESMERVLGLVGHLPSPTRRRILKSNGITSRYYAVDPETGAATHTNAELTADAVRALLAAADVELASVDRLVCGTSTPDQWIPNHALMVHGELAAPPMEVVSTAGVCICGVTALKHAMLDVQGGEARCAVVTASELASSALRGSSFQPPPEGRRRVVPFERDFLRWMLSDGAGAMLVTPAPRVGGVSLRIEWIDIVSYAGELETCMYWGGAKREDGTLLGWRSAASPAAAMDAGMFNIAQDARLLGGEIVGRAVDHAFVGIAEKRGLTADDVDWFAPHYSSNYFRQELHDRFESIGFPIPFDKWFTNLETKGNTGSASIYVILDELVASGRLEDGQKVLCMVPESARFSFAYMLLTVVEDR